MNKIFIILALSIFGTFAHAQAVVVEGDKIKDVSAPAAHAPAAPAEEVATLDAIQNEMDSSAPQQAAVTKVQPVKKKSDSNMYIMGVAGTSGYPEVGNVNGSYAVSGALGMFFDSIMVEAGIGMAKYTMDVRNFSTFNGRDNYDVDQYNFQIGAKYRLMDGSLVPNVGLLAAYSNRTFSLSAPAQSAFNANQTVTGESTTVDAGLSAGVDYEFGTDYAIGLDVKYMFNVSNNASSSNNTNSNITTPGYTGTPIEALQYYTAGLSGRMNF